jgi:cysteine desulfurase / selenocysteine lyase
VADTPLPRHQFPVTDRYHYLNHANMSPLPLVAAEVAHAFIDDFVHRGSISFVEWDARLDDVRASAARLMGVPAVDVAFVKNTTEGLGFVANGLAWQPGDRVIAPGRDFPSAVFPWLSLRDLGVRVDLVDPVGDAWRFPIETVAGLLAGAPTRLVAVSWVHYGRGWRIDLAELAALCHAHGALLCVDVIQGLGVIPTALADWGVDFAAADAHKWLLGPLGTGVLYVAAEHRDLLRPLEPGWASVVDRDNYDDTRLVYDDSARRFEGGSHTIETILQMGAAMDLILDAGVEGIWAHVCQLVDRAAAGLADAGATVLSDVGSDGRSAHLTFTVPGHDATAVWADLQAASIVGAARGGGVRVGPHGYNNTGDIDALVGAVAGMVRESPP